MFRTLLLLVVAAVSSFAANLYDFEYASVDIEVDGVTYEGVTLSLQAVVTDTTDLNVDPTITVHLYDSLSFTVGGLGSGAVTPSGSIFVNQDTEATVGLGVSGFFDIIYIRSDAAFGTYNLEAPFGPQLGEADHPGQWVDVPTSLGLTTLLAINTVENGGTFTASTSDVPEPSTLLGMGLGLTLLAGWRRVRRA